VSEGLKPTAAAKAKTDRLGDFLLKRGAISTDQLEEALAAQAAQGGRLGQRLIELGFIEEQELVEFLSQSYGVPAIDLDRIEIDESIIRIVAPDVARRYTILPVSKAGAKITLAMADPTNVFAVDDVKFMTGYNVEPVVAGETALKTAIDKYYGSSHTIELKKVMDVLAGPTDAGELEVLDEDEEIDLESLEQASEEAPVVRLVNIFLTDAIKRGASDIHIEPYEED
jgi:type IV pilus assembly protein PilB